MAQCILEKMQAEDYYKARISNHGIEYEYDKKNPIKNVLSHFRLPSNLYRTYYDCDAYYYRNCKQKQDGKKYSVQEAEHGDTITSFWTPYKLAVNLVTGRTYNKDVGCLSFLVEKESCYEELLDKEFDGLFSLFAKLCYTPGNFMLLPYGGRRIQRRYIKCEDRIDESIFYCFPSRDYSSFFKYGTLTDWIKSQNLHYLFDGDIKEENLQAFNYTKTPFVRFFTLGRNPVPCMDKKQLIEFLKKAVDLIENRNNV